MKTAMLGLLAETSVHPGSGRGVGVVDLPVARETATDYPVLVGSSLKGALRDKIKTTAPDEETRFGNPQEAGGPDGLRRSLAVATSAQPDGFVPLGYMSAPY